jgi:PTH1 family peptidyl-tRNA hydrolase
VGVGLLPSGGKPSFMDQADFVLGRFSDEEQTLLEQALKKSTEACELFVSKGPAHAMNFANAGEKPEKKPEQKEKAQQRQEKHKEMNGERDGGGSLPAQS